MSVFVKICGLTSRDGVSAAVDAGADAVGFVFAESPRQIDIDAAVELAALVPEGVLKVAVFHHPQAGYAETVADRLEPDWLQTDAEDLAGIRLPSRCAPLPVYRNGRVPEDAVSHPRVLFEGTTSGSGTTADWAQARRLAGSTRVVLAGGLDSGNVATAIAEVSPWGVDVSSGVETRPGVKDPDKIRAFITRVRETERSR